ncbi:MAG: GNAT family N-acetyltransferase [Archaeoglobaceae archaeon]
MRSIKKMLDPQTVSLIGASDREGSVGRTVLENLLTSEERKVFPVNPNRENVLELDCYPSISEVPEKVDLAVIATPAKTVPGIVEECGEAGVEGAIIISSGFREVGEEGKRLEGQIETIRKEHGIRIIGPNCLGVIRPSVNLNASFLKADPQPGRIAFVSQSGALGSAMLDWAIDRHIGFSMFASLGSMIDVDFGDLIDLLGDDYRTRSIMLYMEGVGNAKKFMSASRGFARNKPIIVLKAGRYSESSQAAVSHTGSMAGDDDVYRAAFRRTGVVRVNEIADLFNAAEVLDSKHIPKGPNLAIITNAGGPGILATDILIELGGQLAKLSDDTLKKIDSFLPSHWSKRNPVDVLGDAEIDRFIKSINACLEDKEVHGIVVIYTPQGATDPEELARAIADIAVNTREPIITVFMGGEDVQKATKMISQQNLPVFERPEEAVKAYQYMYKYSRNLKLLYETPEEVPVDQIPPKNNLRALIRRVVKEGRNVLTLEESKKFLIAYGIPTTSSEVTKDVEDAVRKAKSMGFPVALKVLSPHITHKSDVGGIALGVVSEERLREEYELMTNKVKERAPQAKIEGVILQKMLQNIDYEIILGSKKDKDFGSVILFGSGGVGAEVFRDFTVGIPPLNQTLSRRLMEETKIYKFMSGQRGAEIDLRKLEQVLISFSNLIVDFPEIAEMDINPIAISNGQPYALDSRIIIDEEALSYVEQHPEWSHHYPHMVITPYPTRYISPWRLLDGTEVLLRPIRPEDEPLEYEMLTTLSEDSLRGRFFQVIRNIDHEMLTRFTNIDYDREIAMVAEIKEGQKKRIIGIGRLIIESDFEKGEFAVVVHDDYQGRGLGYKLVDFLIGIAQEKGLEKIYGTVLKDNTRMLKMCEELGFDIKDYTEDSKLVEFSLK